MARTPLVIGAFVAAGALAAGLWLGKAWRSPPEANAATAPVEWRAFTAPDLNGTPRRLGEWSDKAIILNFWATWCAPCREEVPMLVDAQRQHGARGLQVIGIAIDDPAAVAEFARQTGINYPLLIGDDRALGWMAQFGNPVESLPFSVVIGRDGSILTRRLGAFSRRELDNWLTQTLGTRS